MGRLIDADEFIREVDEEADTRFLGYDGGVNLGDVKEWIDNQPTVDAVPVVHGEWKACEDDWNYETIYECLICGFGIKTEQGSKFDWNFCPNCGADMRGEKDE